MATERAEGASLLQGVRVEEVETSATAAGRAEHASDNCSVLSAGSGKSPLSPGRASFTPWQIRSRLHSGVQQAVGLIQRGSKASVADSNAAWSKSWKGLIEGADVDSIDEDMLRVCERWRRSAQGERHDLRHKIASTIRRPADPRFGRLTTAIRNGIPPSLRDPLWYACSGGVSKQRESKQSYEDFLEAGRLLIGTDVVHVLEADVPRTGLDAEMQETLRDLLLAWVARNKEIGYCQSMNFICAALLSHLPVDRAFWSFCSLIEDLLPEGYYTVCLSGLRVDLRVLDSLIAQYFPRLQKHLASINVELMPITMNWFLCLFVNTLPAQESCRVLDCLLHEGSKVLFRASLALLRLREAELLQAANVMDAYALLRAPFGGDGLGLNVDPQSMMAPVPASASHDFLKVMYSQWSRGLSNDTLLQLRAEQAKAVQEEDAKRLPKATSSSVGAAAAAEPQAMGDAEELEQEMMQRRKSLLEESSMQPLSSFLMASALREVPAKNDTAVQNWISYVSQDEASEDGELSSPGVA